MIPGWKVGQGLVLFDEGETWRLWVVCQLLTSASRLAWFQHKKGLFGLRLSEFHFVGVERKEDMLKLLGGGCGSTFRGSSHPGELGSTTETWGKVHPSTACL